MSAPYVDSDDLKASLQLTGTTYADDDIELACSVASDVIDRELGRKFSKDSSDVTRLYTALDSEVLNIRDLVSLTTLKTDEDGDGTFETTWGADDYKLGPMNATADSEPYTQISVDMIKGDYRFPQYVQGGVQIVGKWGWPKVPLGVQQAAAIIAVQLMKRRRENPGFIITSETAIVILRNDPQIAALLKGLSRPKVVEN